MLAPVSHRKIAPPALLLLVMGLWASAGHSSGAVTGLVLTPCRLEHALGVTSLEAQCGRLKIPENRSLPGGRQLELFVARIPALSRKHSPEPLFVLAGGPGLGASTFYASVAPAFARIRRNHDIVIVDQRGTGKSQPLNCPFDEQQFWDASNADTVRIMSECRALLEPEHELTQYTTSIAVQDLDAVRAALGYARIALYGSSYGTRVAQHYARRYPQHTQALILDGVVPPAQVLGPSTPLDAEHALHEIFARCRADAACFKRFGDPAVDYQQLRAKLTTGSVPVTLLDARTGLPTQLQFSAAAFAGALRLASYSADQAALLPLALHLANDLNQYGPLASLYLTAARGYDAVLAYGMHNSVVCAEDVPLFATQTQQPGVLADTFLGNTQVEALQALCRAWPRGPMDADLHQPLASHAPALLMSGTADPVTPATFGDMAALGFASALHLKFAGQGHGQLLHACVDRIMADFLQATRTSAAATVDTECVRKLRPAPFFLSLNGPAP
jgi:pimeloyl-ACP methyl ester carboxylesterase